MAFHILKKKKDMEYDDFPYDEKAEILDDGEDEFEFPAEGRSVPSDFGSGFRAPEELRPPTEQPHETQLPPFRSPEPLPMPPPMNESREMEPIKMHSNFGPVPRIKDKPHIFIKIDKYKEVMQKVRELEDKIETTKKVLSKIEEKNREEQSSTKDAIDVLMKIEKLVSYLDDTFTSPED